MKIEKVLMKLLINEPYYGYIASKIRFVESDKVSKTKLQLSMNPKVLYNGEWFEALDESKQIGVLLHELLHLALLHFSRRGSRERLLWNVACDISVSELMGRFEVYDDLVTREVIFREIGIKLDPMKPAEVYYEHLLQVEDRIHFNNKAGEATIVFEGGKEYSGEILDEMMEGDLELNALISELSKVMDSATKEGVIEDGLMTHLEDAYHEYRVNWRMLMKRFLSGHGRIQVRKSYKRQSRRFDELPGTKRSVGVRALLAIDESASISDEQVAAFHKELLKINKITGADITALRFDTECSEPCNLREFVLQTDREKRGGTDFRPVFKLADELKVPLVILFTDGDGEAPSEVNQQVLWILTGNGKSPSEYGLAVKFEE